MSQSDNRISRTVVAKGHEVRAETDTGRSETLGVDGLPDEERELVTGPAEVAGFDALIGGCDDVGRTNVFKGEVVSIEQPFQVRDKLAGDGFCNDIPTDDW